MPDSTEYELISRAQAGEHRAFGRLVGLYQNRIFRFVLRLCNSRDEAMDLTQDTFIKAHQGLPGWRPEAQFKTWLFRIAHNTTLDALRRRQCVEFVPLPDLTGDDAGALLQSAAPQPDQQIADWQRIELLDRVLRQLPAEQREVLLLRELEGMSYAEISLTLGVEAGTVKSRLARARAAALVGYQKASGENVDD